MGVRQGTRNKGFPPDRADAQHAQDAKDGERDDQRERLPDTAFAYVALAPFLLGTNTCLLGALFALSERHALADVLALVGGQLISPLAEPALGFRQQGGREQRAGVLVASLPLGEQPAEALPPE
jgi:hypothetical protein